MLRRKKTQKWKGVVSLFLSLIMIGSLMAGSIQVLAEGEDLVIRISSAEDLEKLAADCRLDSWSVGKRVELQNNLNLTGSTFTTIPTFGGIFDGNGYTISGYDVELEGSNQGFFRYVQESGKLLDLNLVASVTAAGTAGTVGGLAGENQGTIRGCTVTLSLDGSSSIGGIAGKNEETGVIDRCVVKGSIAGEHYTGGIAGMNLGVIQRCTNYSSVNTSLEEITFDLQELNLEQLNSTENISTNTDTGGIAGYSSGSIVGCNNRGRIGYQHVGYNIGGIVGRQAGYLEDCYNYGTIQGRKDVAGIAGQMEPYMLLQYSEDTLQKLDAAFEELDTAVGQLLDDMDATSSNMTGHMDTILDLMDNIQNQFQELSNQTVKYANGISDSATEIADRIDLALNRTHTVLNTLQGVSDYLTAAMDKLEKAVERMDDVTDDGEIILSQLEDIMDTLAAANNHLSEARKAGQNAVSILQKKAEQETTAYETEEEAAASSEEISSLIGEGDSILLRHFTEEELDSLETNLRDMGSQIQAAAKAVEESLQYAKGLRPYLESMAESGDRAETYLEDGLDYMTRVSTSLGSAFDQADMVIDALEGNDAVTFPKLDAGYETLLDEISDLCGSVFNVLDIFNQDTESNSKRINQDIRVISDCIIGIEGIVLDAIGEQEEKAEDTEDGSRLFQEVTPEEQEGILQGKVTGSTNYGTIEADIAVGGIVGNMAIEYDFDPEEDISIEGKTSLNFQYKTSTVVSSCINYGEIVAKKDYAGGVIGKMDLGTARDCQSYGNVTSENGNYVGGIAGESSALIENSYTRCKLSGASYVGGIAGMAGDLQGCCALIRLEEATQFYGAIAGDVKKNGEVQGNYFVEGDWDGIDRVSYASAAEPVSYEEMIAWENVPMEFKEFMIRFVADDMTVAEISFSYGDSLSAERIPEVPEKDGYDAAWEETDYSSLVFNEVVNAVYTKKLTVIASDTRTKNEKTPVLLLEGTFDEKAAVTVDDITEQIEIALADGETVLSGWHMEVVNPGQENATYSARISKPEAEGELHLWIQQEGVWTEISYEESGSYLLYTMEGNMEDICILGVSHTREMVLSVLVALLLLGMVLIIVRNKQKDGRTRKKAEREEKKLLRKQEKAKDRTERRDARTQKAEAAKQKKQKKTERMQTQAVQKKVDQQSVEHLQQEVTQVTEEK